LNICLGAPECPVTPLRKVIQKTGENKPCSMQNIVDSECEREKWSHAVFVPITGGGDRVCCIMYL